MCDCFEGPLFIIGMPRSGTKLLRDLLNNHPQIIVPKIETEFLPYLYKRTLLDDLSIAENFQKFYREMIKLPYFIFKKKEGRILSWREWHGACNTYDAASIFEALIRLETANIVGSNIIWGDKSPSYVTQIPLIKQLYPNARFLHIIRDVRDYCLSIHKAWGKDVFRAAERWGFSTLKARHDGLEIGNDYMEVFYESLIKNPEKVLRNICYFLGLNYSNSMTNLISSPENIGDTKGRMEIVSSNSKKFHKIKNRAQIRRIEELAYSGLIAFDYNITEAEKQKHLSFLEWHYRRILDGVNLVTHGRQGLINSLIFHYRYFVATRGGF